MRPLRFCTLWTLMVAVFTAFRLVYVQLQFDAKTNEILYQTVVNQSKVSYLGVPKSILLYGKSCPNCFKVTCSELLFNSQNEDVRKAAHSFMATYVPVLPTEEEFIRMTSNCDNFKQKYNYLAEPFSEEEKDFPLAFNILAHRDVAQIELLLRTLYAPQNSYCIHIDAKASKGVHDAIKSLAKCFSNVFIASKLERIVYAGISRLNADLNCMKDHLQSPIKWKYLLNMAAQAYPLKTNREMVQILKIYNGSNDIEGLYGRTYLNFRYVNEWKESYLDTNHPRLEKTGRLHRSLPHNLGFVKGSAYGIFSRDFVDYVINDRVAIDLLDWSVNTWSPDEHYWAILHHTYSNPHIHPPGSYSGWLDSELFLFIQIWCQIRLFYLKLDLCSHIT